MRARRRRFLTPGVAVDPPVGRVTPGVGVGSGCRNFAAKERKELKAIRRHLRSLRSLAATALLKCARFIHFHSESVLRMTIDVDQEDRCRTTNGRFLLPLNQTLQCERICRRATGQRARA